MKGLTFNLNKEKKDNTSIGYDKIYIVDRFIYRTIDYPMDSEGKTCHVYEYMLDCIGYDLEGTPTYMQQDEDEFMEEVSYGIYELL